MLNALKLTSKIKIKENLKKHGIKIFCVTKNLNLPKIISSNYILLTNIEL